MTGRDGVRPWHGSVASADELDEERTWVVWGVGAAADRAAVPEDAPQDVRANEIARTIARTRDPDWAHDAGPTWVGIVEADEDDVDAWMRDDEAVRGYAPYLIAEDAEIPSDEPMRGVLRNDVVRRRPFDAGQTGLDDR